MAYPKELLSDGEVVIHDMRPHWKSILFPIVMLLVIVGVTSFLLATFDGSTVRWVIVAGALIALGIFVIHPFLRWATTEYVFTNRRIITRTGIIAKSGRGMPLSKVNDVAFSYTIIERMLSCGTLQVESASEKGSLTIRNVPKVEDLQREVSRLHEEDDARRRGSGSVPPD